MELFKKGTSTTFNDVNGRAICVGDIVKEYCNGLVAPVIWSSESGTFCLGNNCNPHDYTIEDSDIEWEVIETYDGILIKDMKMERE